MPVAHSRSHEFHARMLPSTREGRKPHPETMEAHQGLVIEKARRHVEIGRRLGFDLDDLIQEGQLGLGRGLSLYDASRGYRASTYVQRWIVQGITRALKEKGHIIHIPSYMIDLVRKYYRKQDEIAATVGRPPSFDEVADAIEVPAGQRDLLKGALAVYFVGDGGAACPGDDADGMDPLDMLPGEEGEADPGPDIPPFFKDLLSSLNKQERMVISHQYGINGADILTYNEIAERLGGGKIAVHAHWIARKAMAKLRKKAAERGYVYEPRD